jgi:hypothetical protein
MLLLLLLLLLVWCGVVWWLEPGDWPRLELLLATALQVAVDLLLNAWRSLLFLV